MRYASAIALVLPAALLVWKTAPAQPAQGFLNGEELRKLVNGRTWRIGWQRDVDNALTATHWDFRADGSVCARFVGGKPKDKCADDGKWRLQGDQLCWDLERIGATYGYKSTCVQVRKVDDKRYEAIAPDGKLHPPLFYPLN